MDGYESRMPGICRPSLFSPKVLLKKVEVILKRSGAGNIMEYRDLRIDFDKRNVWNRDRETKLTIKEWKVFVYFSGKSREIL